MISVIVPVKNEEENIAPLIREIVQAYSNAVPISEIIYVDDGSDDRTYEALREARGRTPMLRVIRHGYSCGQSAALWTGIKAAANDIIVTLDGDGQNNPADIGKLFDQYQSMAQSYPTQKILVAGQREKRRDNWVRRFSSRAANTIRASVLRDGTRDTGCSLKLFRRQDYLDLPYFNHMHRYIPALMKRDGIMVTHVNVSHRPREKGQSKYGTIDRLAAGMSDLFGVRWLLNRARAQVNIVEDLN